MAEICIGCGLRVDPDSGRLVANTGEWPFDDTVGPLADYALDVYCEPTTGRLRVYTDDFWLGGEESLVGSVPTTGARKVHKTFSRTVVGDGTNNLLHLDPTWFQHGIVSAMLSIALVSFPVVGSVALNAVTLTTLSLSIWGPDGTNYPGNANVNISADIWGW